MERTDIEQWKSKEVSRLLALVETERRYWQEIVSTLPVCLAIVDGQLRVLSANRAFRARFQVRNEELRLRRIDETIKAPDLKELVEWTIRRQQPPKPVTREIQGVGPMRITLLPHRDWDEDTSVHALLVAEALDAMPPAAPADEESAESAAEAPVAGVVATPALPDSLPAAVWTAELPSMQVTWVSPSAGQLTGIPVEKWTEPGFLISRLHASDREAVAAHYGLAATTGKVHSAEFRLEGNPRWFRESVRADLEARKMHGVTTDISERRTVEEHLLQSQRMDALAAFGGRAAHDLNNPLMIVSGYGEELLDSFGSGDGRREEMSELLGAAARIGGLSKKLYDFSRKPLAVKLAPDGVELAEIVEDAAQRVAPMEVVNRTGAGLRVAADPEVFADLLAEIVKALDEPIDPLATTTIQAREGMVQELAAVAPGALQPGAYAVMLIDRTPGKAGAAHAVAAKRSPFEQITANPALARGFRAVESWGGSIWASPGGNQVRLLLRLVSLVKPTEDAAAPAPEEAPAAKAPAVGPPPAPAKVLVVDNESGIRSLICKILTREGYAAREARDPHDALKMLAAETYDLLLTDVVMPEMQGRELAEKAVARHPGIRVLYVSGFTDSTAVETGQFPPGSHFLQKPFTLGSLLRKVKEVTATASAAE